MDTAAMRPSDRAPQAAFAAALLDPGAAVPTDLRAPGGGSAERRFAVYRNNVTVALIEAIEAGFPVTRRHLGDAAFRQLARDFVRHCPPAVPVVRAYGEGFAECLSARGELAEHWPWLADVARLEWLRRQSCDAADMPLQAAAQLADADPDQLMQWRVRVHPAARWMRSAWPVQALWAWRPGDSLPAGGQDVLCMRPALEVVHHLLPPGGETFLQGAADGLRMAELLEHTLALSPEADIPGLLELAVNSGAFARFETR